MSRIGKQPVLIPDGVKVEVNGSMFKVEGPKGKLSREYRPEVVIDVKSGEKIITLTRKDDSKQARAFHGMERALISNMVEGVSKGFIRELQLIGVGYRADIAGDVLNLALGYSHPIDFKLPQGVKGSVIKDGRDLYVKLEGVDKQLIGETAAKIRQLRSPEPYKGKGIRYKGEVIKLKAGKSSKK